MGRKILLLDDDQALLDSYSALLQAIPSAPEVRACLSGPQALAMLDSEPFSLLIADLRMPKMDGLQVLAIARRKFPRLRIVVLTAVADEEYRARAYAMGAELFWQKPTTQEEIRQFQESVESLLAYQPGGGFRGMQSKSLVDIIQLEGLAQSSSVLRILRGSVEGRIWLLNGEIIDAQTGSLSGEEAFHEIFSWKSGNFESLPAEPDHPRTIQTSTQGLLLNSAQVLDESTVQSGPTQHTTLFRASSLAVLSRFEGVVFVLAIAPDGQFESWGLENAQDIVQWARATYHCFDELGRNLNTGELDMILASDSYRHMALVCREQYILCAGFNQNQSKAQVQKTMKEMTTKWAS